MSVIAEGMISFATKSRVSGVVKYLPDPQSVMDLIQSGKLQDHILLVQGGTTTFLSPALTMGAIGVITMSGAPESHLGILSREFQIPCVMTAYLTNSESRYAPGGDNDAHFKEVIEALDGKKVEIDADDDETGRIIAL
ncbi:hypothetical protein H0Z60_13440 [Ectothiorhodospiraceae bacterium WFHF3C12]|nr:hypothetical protein [Ectothiorhodospiraceae bacterium WFHF3C12]